MGTIYKAGDGTVFECKLWHEDNGTSYALNTSDITEILAYPLYSLSNLGESFDFIGRYLPHFDTDENVAALDDLDCLIGNECDALKLERLTAVYGSDPERWKKERDVVFEVLLNQAITVYKGAQE